jgi:3-oxoacyl-[acyl-carrier protein] reductase
MSSPVGSKAGFTLITGATSTIGMEVARRRSFTDSLMLHGRDMRALEGLAAELRGVTEVRTWCRDLANPVGLHAELLQLLEHDNIKVERVVHAAGHLKILPLRSLELADTMAVFNINIVSIVEILRVLARKPYREHLKSVVLLSALFSKFGDKGNAVYSSSKGALNSLVKGLAVEFPQTRYNSLILGAVRTRMTEHLFLEGENTHRFSRYLLGTGLPSYVVDAVDFLLKEDLWMTGQELFLDGGASIA